MTRLLQPFVIAVTVLLAGAYVYVAARLASGPWGSGLLAIPFVLVWIVPVIYWGERRDRKETRIDGLVHQASYLSMAWVSFILVGTFSRDLVLLVTALLSLDEVHRAVAQQGIPVVLVASLCALVVGALTALRGPRVKEVVVRVSALHPDLKDFRIVQISDLHVGRNIRRSYVERVVERTQDLAPDLVAITGDMVDGAVERLGPDVAPLAGLAKNDRAFFVLGNHDCYSGAPEWIAHFRHMGMRVLLNEHIVFRKGMATVVVGGVVDPAYRLARPEISLDDAPNADFRLLLAHNPKFAPLGAQAGFDLQLSGHTHAGQFFPWTLAVRLVHAPHVAGLSRERAMWVYVSAGTGTWGPPVRFGTSPEITLIRLMPA
ncbi:MAG: metallophosphoesterase [Gammaproteobacteria bacterium]|nr:metallophosphoesterase [Gammaproteobacteria bacterium]